MTRQLPSIYQDCCKDPENKIFNQERKIRTNYNTDGWGNKLVTISARHLDNFIVTINFSLIYLIRDFGSGQILQPVQFFRSPVLIAIGILSANSATNVYSLNCRAVIGKILEKKKR
jgi:hypothetical protein